MMLNNIKKIVLDNLNKKIKFKVNCGRGQEYEFYGIITAAYKAIFVIKVFGENTIKSFSYADVLIGNLMFL